MLYNKLYTLRFMVYGMKVVYSRKCMFDNIHFSADSDSGCKSVSLAWSLPGPAWVQGWLGLPCFWVIKLASTRRSVAGPERGLQDRGQGRASPAQAGGRSGAAAVPYHYCQAASTDPIITSESNKWYVWPLSGPCWTRMSPGWLGNIWKLLW